MKVIRTQKYVPGFYKYLSWLFPVLRRVAPKIVNTMSQVGQAMMAAA